MTSRSLASRPENRMFREMTARILPKPTTARNSARLRHVETTKHHGFSIETSTAMHNTIQQSSSASGRARKAAPSGRNSQKRQLEKSAGTRARQPHLSFVSSVLSITLGVQPASSLMGAAHTVCRRPFRWYAAPSMVSGRRVGLGAGLAQNPLRTQPLPGPHKL